MHRHVRRGEAQARVAQFKPLLAWRNLHRDAIAGTQPAEIEQPVRDLLAAKSFIANQPKVLFQVFDVG